MIVVDGKEVFTDLHELVAVEHTALVIIDMQRDFVESDGLFGRLGVDVSAYKAVVPAIADLRGRAAAAGVLVVHVQNAALPDRMSDSPAQIRFNMRMHGMARGDGPPLRYTVPGTPGSQFVSALSPRAGELVVDKVPFQRLLGHQPRAATAQQRHPQRRDCRLHHRGVRGVHRARCDVQRLLRGAG